jgi:hypothetical protein
MEKNERFKNENIWLFRLKVENAVQSHESRILAVQEFKKNKRLKGRLACDLQDKIPFSTKIRMKQIFQLLGSLFID